MKKLIGILGVAVIAMAMFFNTNTMNGSNNSFDLASLLTISSANAECDNCPGGSNICRVQVDCDGSTEHWWGTTTNTEVFCCNGQGARSTCLAKSCS
jgi:hypothetical protein